MPLQPFQPLRSGGQLSAGELNRLAMETEAQDRVAVSGVELARNAGGLQLLVRREVQFWAKITGNSGSGPTAHSWTEQVESSTGTFSDLTGGRTGTTSVFPAYALDGGIISTNSIVRLFLGVGGDFYLVDAGSNGAGMMFSGARVITNTSNSITGGAGLQSIAFGTETFDTDNYWSSGNNTKFILADNTYYLVGGQIGVPETDTYTVILHADDFATIAKVKLNVPTGSNGAFLNLHGIFKSGTSDFVQLQIECGSNQTITSGNAEMWIQKLGT